MFEASNVCKLFADDVKLYSVIDIGSSATLEPGLACLASWSNIWQLGINSGNCSILHIGKNNQNIQYSIAGFDVPNVSDVRDLGVTYDGQLKFEEYINSIVGRACQRIYLLFRGFVSRDITLLKRAYCTYVRPILEYCTPVWNLFLLKDINKIENVQRYFTRRLFPLSTLSYRERLSVLDLEPLELRRLRWDLKVYFQIINGSTVLDIAQFFVFRRIITVPEDIA